MRRHRVRRLYQVGTLVSSDSDFSIATHRDCAAYNYRTVQDAAASRTCCLNRYA